VPASGGTLDPTDVADYVTNLASAFGLQDYNWHVQRITIAAAAIVLLPTGASTGVSLTTRGDHGTCPASYPVATTPAAAAARRLSEAAYQQTYALCKRAVDPNNLAVEIDVLTIRYGAPTPAARAAATAHLEGWPIPAMPSSTGATCEPCAAAGGGASTLTETSTSEENGFFSPPPAASPPPPVASPPPSPLPALPPIGGSNLTITDDGEDMTLLWIIIGATVGVLAIAGAVVGGLAAAGVFRRRSSEEEEPALAKQAPEPASKPEEAPEANRRRRRRRRRTDASASAGGFAGLAAWFRPAPAPVPPYRPLPESHAVENWNFKAL